MRMIQAIVAPERLAAVTSLLAEAEIHRMTVSEVHGVSDMARLALDEVSAEPMVRIEVAVPSGFLGDITGDLSGKRGRIQGTDMLSGDQALIHAIVPLSEVTNYQSQLKSVTGGQGSFTMELDHYDPVPSHVQQQIAAEYKPQEHDD